MASVLLVTSHLAIWGQKLTQALVAHSVMQQPELSHDERAAQRRSHVWEQHVLFIGVHVKAAALALAAGPHPTCILGPPQQCLPYLLHSCLHTHQLQIEGELSGWQH
jgi:hypothetical protein